MFNIIWNLVNSFRKDCGEFFLNQNNIQTSIAGKWCLHTGIRPLIATADAVYEVFVAVGPIYLHRFRHLNLFGTIQCY